MARSKKTRTCAKCGLSKPVGRFKSPTGNNARNCSTCRKGTKKLSKSSAHDLRQVETYGYEPGEWQKLHEAQGGGCWICTRANEIGGRRHYNPKRGYNLHSDHDHRTGHLRGQLCAQHNNQLLRNNDDPAILQAAIDYLMNPPAIEHLGIRLHIDFREGETRK